ncbi:MAG TPA: hypothetical protein GX507_01785 [Clostridia bacterium]|nr:hypothetical protein [Clostridia bacterium]
MAFKRWFLSGKPEVNTVREASSLRMCSKRKDVFEKDEFEPPEDDLPEMGLRSTFAGIRL